MIREVIRQVICQEVMRAEARRGGDELQAKIDEREVAARAKVGIGPDASDAELQAEVEGVPDDCAPERSSTKADLGPCENCGKKMREKYGTGRFCDTRCRNRKTRAQHPEAGGFVEQASVEAADINVVPAELLEAAGLTASMASIVVAERAARAFTSQEDAYRVRATPVIAAVCARASE